MILDVRVFIPPLLLIAAVAVSLDAPARKHPPGVLVADEPHQSETVEKSTWERDGYTFAPLARFRLRARVLSTHRYYLGDARLSPVDLALGWGAMSDQSVLDRLEIRQGNRAFWLRAESSAD